MPRSFLVATLDELAGAIAEAGTPCVLKPVTSWRAIGTGGERVAPLYVGDADEARRVGADLIRPDAPVLVQELAPGDARRSSSSATAAGHTPSSR